MRALASGLLLSLSFLAALIASPTTAQMPAFVPSARYYGAATVFGAAAPAYASIIVQGTGGAVCGSGAVSPYGGSYSVDIQPISPCAGPITFTVNGQQADQTSIVPNYLSGAVQLNLTVSNGCGYSYAAPAYSCSAYATPPPPVSSGCAYSYATAAYGCSAYAPPPPPVSAGGVSISFQAGWNLVAGPAGAVLSGDSGPLFTFQPGDATYETLPSSTPLQMGYGYWALFPTTTVGLSTPYLTLTTVSRSIPAGQVALIGNPFPRPATVSGASAVYTYDPIRGYQTTTLLQPGQGAWAVSATGQVVIAST